MNITKDNYRKFCTYFQRFENLINLHEENSKVLMENSMSLKIPGKYVFRQEAFSDRIRKLLLVESHKTEKEVHKFFDYAGTDTLYLNHDLLMIIPLTSYVFSYTQNSYKKAIVDFTYVKIKTFLPGSATVHFGDNFYISGGEIKEEGTQYFLSMNIKDKSLKELKELEVPRRFHTMAVLLKRWFIIVGGWSTSAVEVIEVDEKSEYDLQEVSWTRLKNMKNKRADSTIYLFNDRWLYVFGGWSTSKKECIDDIERLDLFEENGQLKENTEFEVLPVDYQKMYLKRYNMGIIKNILNSMDDTEVILLVGGYDDEYDYSTSVVRIEINKPDGNVEINKEINGLPTEGESSFWYEKEFHILENLALKEKIAVNYNCFNNIYVFNFSTSEFKLYTSKLTN